MARGFQEIRLSPEGKMGLYEAISQLEKVWTDFDKPICFPLSCFAHGCEIAEHKAILGSTFSVFKMGGSYSPRKEFAILKNNKNQTIKYIKTGSGLKVMFDDMSYYQLANDSEPIFMRSYQFEFCDAGLAKTSDISTDVSTEVSTSSSVASFSDIGSPLSSMSSNSVSDWPDLYSTIKLSTISESLFLEEV